MNLHFIKILIPLFLTVVLSACATYKIVPENEITLSQKNFEEITVTKDNQFPEGGHCFEPMFYVLTLGIIPTHCVDTFRVSEEDEEIALVKVTSMQGWITLLIAPFPTWKYGYSTDVELEIKEMVIDSKK